MEVGAPVDPAGLDDRELLDLVVQTQVAENAARARRLAAMSEFHARCVADQHRQRRSGERSWFVLTALQETGAEIAPLLGISDTSVGIQIEICDRLRDLFPTVWALCEAGRLDLGRARLFLDGADTLADPEDVPELAGLLDAYLARHDSGGPVLGLTRSQLQRAIRYRALKFDQKSTEHTFPAAFAGRRVRLRPDEHTGIGCLSVTGMVTDLIAADYRLTLIAKNVAQHPTETRTLEQLRADILLDLIHGRLTVTARDSELEHEATDSGADPAGLIQRHRVGGYGRPVINVTVPIQTLLGVSNQPGLLSGGIPIPADLARLIAADPDATWYRMLTDPARGCLELSTHSYAPTPPIAREVTARDQTCIYPGCCRPAVRVELDHREPHPDGPTSTGNLAPLCRRHHKVKHSDGFTLTANPDGSYTWTTRAGSTFTTRPPDQPHADWPTPSTLTTAHRPDDDPTTDDITHDKLTA